MDDQQGSEITWASELASLWAKSQPVVTSYIAGCISKFHDVDDLVQETAAAAARNFKKYDRERSFLAWVIGIARHKVLDYQRKQTRDRHLFDHELLERFGPIYEDMESGMDRYRQHLDACMRKLMPRGKKLLELRYVRDMTPSQISDQMGVSRNVVNVTLFRIRQTLRRCVEAQLASEA